MIKIKNKSTKMKTKNKAIVIIVVIVLIVLIGQRLFDKEEDTWIILNGETRTIVKPQTSEIKLISETRGECSYQASYIYQAGENTDFSKKVIRSLKASFGQIGWKLENKRTEDKFCLLEFTPKRPEQNEAIKVVISFENGRGTLFGIDYRWPPCSGDQIR